MSRFWTLTNILIAINLAFFIVAYPIILFYPSAVDYIALKPAFILHGQYLWTLITSMFMHGGITHIFVNMVSLFFLGNFVERIIGRKRFLWFYLISGILSGLFFVFIALAFNFDMNTYAVGASGALFGLAGLMAVITPRLPVLVFFIIPMPMWIASIFLLAALWAVSYFSGLPIGNTAHLGGLIAGLIYGFYLRNKYKHKIRLLDRYIR